MTDKVLDIVSSYYEEKFGISTDNLEFPDIEIISENTFELGTRYLVRVVANGVRYFNITAANNSQTLYVEVFSMDDNFTVEI